MRVTDLSVGGSVGLEFVYFFYHVFFFIFADSTLSNTDLNIKPLDFCFKYNFCTRAGITLVMPRQ